MDCWVLPGFGFRVEGLGFKFWKWEVGVSFTGFFLKGCSFFVPGVFCYWDPVIVLMTGLRIRVLHYEQAFEVPPSTKLSAMNAAVGTRPILGGLVCIWTWTLSYLICVHSWHFHEFLHFGFAIPNVNECSLPELPVSDAAEAAEPLRIWAVCNTSNMCWPLLTRDRPSHKLIDSPIYSRWDPKSPIQGCYLKSRC